jgi:chemotaxis signal transduction protein
MFSVPQAYTFHKCSCQKTKKQLSSALDKAKRGLAVQEVSKIEVMQSTTVESPPDQNVAIKQESNNVALAMQHEVRLMICWCNLLNHYIPVRVPP